MKRSIRIKFGILLAVLLVMVVTILSYSVLQGVKGYQEKQYRNLLEQQSKIANLYIREVYVTENKGEEADEFFQNQSVEFATQIGNMTGMHVILYNNKLKEIGNSLPTIQTPNLHDLLPIVLENKILYQQVGDNIFFLAPIRSIDQQIGILRLEYSLVEQVQFYENLQVLFLSIGSIVLVISFIIGYFFFNPMVKGILVMKQVTEGIMRGCYPITIPFVKNDELGELSRGIYLMGQQIKENIEEMERKQENLHLSVQKLKILEKQQKQFIGNITHEFKTPLTVILAYVDLLDMYTDDPQLGTDARMKITTETKRLYEMVDKVLHLASLEKYDFEYQVQKIEVGKTLQAMCDRLAGKAKKFQLCLHTNLQESYIRLDKESFEHIFMNLIDNAIKYNEPQGSIFIQNYIIDQHVYIDIKDTGIGIPNELKDKIFEPFFTVNRDRSRQTGGTGLGLPLVKELVERQRGAIEAVETVEKGKGTTIRVSFPIYDEL